MHAFWHEGMAAMGRHFCWADLALEIRLIVAM